MQALGRRQHTLVSLGIHKRWLPSSLGIIITKNVGAFPDFSKHISPGNEITVPDDYEISDLALFRSDVSGLRFHRDPVLVPALRVLEMSGDWTDSLRHG